MLTLILMSMFIATIAIGLALTVWLSISMFFHS